jgi:hypothetical protein
VPGAAGISDCLTAGEARRSLSPILRYATRCRSFALQPGLLRLQQFRCLGQCVHAEVVIDS